MTAWTGCGVDVMSGLIVGVVGLPLLTAGAVLALYRRPRLARAVALGGALLGALAASWLLSLIGQGTLVTFDWIPGIGSMGFYAGATGIYLTLLTAWSALLCLLYAALDETLSPVATALGLFATSSGTAAFAFDHFLARYVALELTALCAVLLLVAERPAPEGPRRAWSGYLVLRLGDAGLLAAILLLLRHSGTFAINTALECGAALPPAVLLPIAAGSLLAVWVKTGSIPFHTWLAQGTRLSWPVLALVYATIIPNLGGYLLYRVAPLLMGAGALRQTVLWLGAAVALLAMGLALTRQDLKRALLYVVVAQGGLALSLAAADAPEAMLMCLLGQTPVRLLLFLGAGAAEATGRGRLVPLVVAFGLGGLTLVGLTLVTVWWARQAGGNPALVVAEAVVALTAVWAVRACRRLFHLYHDDLSPPATTIAWPRLAAIALLASAMLAGWLAFDPLVQFLAPTMRLALPPAPTLPQLLRYLFTHPALIGTLLLALGYGLLVRWPPFRPWLERLDNLGRTVSQLTGRVTLEGALFGLAGGLRRTVERGLLERFNRLVAQGVPALGRGVRRTVERGLLERFNRLVAQGVPALGRGVRRTVELGGLERFNRLAVQSARRLGEALRRLHTGRLRRNLLWGAISLALALIVLLLLYPL